MADSGTLIIFGILVIGFLVYTGTIQLPNQQPAGTNTITNTITEYVSVNPDMRAVFEPLYSDTPLFSNCLALGGTILWEHDRVGCVSLPAPIVDCGSTDPRVSIIRNTCTSIGGSWICNPQNVYCSYGG